MAAVTICSDCGAPKYKVWHCFHCFPIYFPWRDGTRCHDLRFLNVELEASFFSLHFHFHQEAFEFLFTFCHKGGVICIYEVTDIFPSKFLPAQRFSWWTLLLLSHFSRVWLLCDPIDSSLPGSPVPGILQARTLEWVAFPSPMHENEKWKWSRSVMSDPQRPHGLQPSRLLRPWHFSDKSTGVGCH